MTKIKTFLLIFVLISTYLIVTIESRHYNKDCSSRCHRCYDPCREYKTTTTTEAPPPPEPQPTPRPYHKTRHRHTHAEGIRHGNFHVVCHGTHVHVDNGIHRRHRHRRTSHKSKEEYYQVVHNSDAKNDDYKVYFSDGSVQNVSKEGIDYFCAGTNL
ncbi:unnamed protein product [Lepeophtheirus salmonis]|uniref:(salmon louse) hypothetical protein n=1 Tax=Lepeophtheirus salmonis TaxID=72036 RepID=A0A7R8HCX0_LEPSM|nr:unnamed protein product [Lepeophtheirus salmonis]CAF3010214.1 unnamed protein product [Lepeophtheirus salmonis]